MSRMRWTRIERRSELWIVGPALVSDLHARHMIYAHIRKRSHEADA